MSAELWPRNARWRLLAAIALVPFVDAAAGLLVPSALVAMGARSGVPGTHERYQMAVLSGVMGFVVAGAGGVPAVYWLKRTGRLSFVSLLGAGMALGNLPSACFGGVLGAGLLAVAARGGSVRDHLVPLPELLVAVLRVVVIGCAMGGISAVFIWFVAISGTTSGEAAEP